MPATQWRANMASTKRARIFISYKRVTVSWSTHSEDGVTEKDFAGAAQSDKIARVFGA